jgi:hypothetical protein
MRGDLRISVAYCLLLKVELFVTDNMIQYIFQELCDV